MDEHLEGSAKPAGPQQLGERARAVLPWVIERTLLAWVRTGLAVMAFGGFLVRYGLRRPEAAGSDRAVGLALLLTGGVVCALGARRYLVVHRTLARNEAPTADPFLPVAIALVVAVASLVLVALLYTRGGD